MPLEERDKRTEEVPPRPLGQTTRPEQVLGEYDSKTMVPCLSFTYYRRPILPPAEDVVEFVERSRALLPSLTFRQTSHDWKPLTKAPWNRFVRFAEVPRKNGFLPLVLADAPEDCTAARLDCYFFNNDPTLTMSREERHAYYQPYVDKYGFVSAPISVMIRLTLPLEHELSASPTDFRDWLLGQKLLQRPLVTADCGFALNVDDEALTFSVAGAILRQHPGFDIFVSPALLSVFPYDPDNNSLHHRIRRVNWLTVVSDAALEDLGGRQHVGEQLVAMDGIELYELQHGILVQAGPAPSVGDPARGDDLPWYRHVARVLKPIRMPFIAGRNEGECYEWLSALDQEVF